MGTFHGLLIPYSYSCCIYSYSWWLGSSLSSTAERPSNACLFMWKWSYVLQKFGGNVQNSDLKSTSNIPIFGLKLCLGTIFSELILNNFVYTSISGFYSCPSRKRGNIRLCKEVTKNTSDMNHLGLLKVFRTKMPILPLS